MSALNGLLMDVRRPLYFLKIVLAASIVLVGFIGAIYLDYSNQKEVASSWIKSWNEEIAVGQLNPESSKYSNKIMELLRQQVPIIQSWKFSETPAESSVLPASTCYLNQSFFVSYLGLPAGQIQFCYSIRRVVIQGLQSKYALIVGFLLALSFFAYGLLRSRYQLQTQKIQQEAEVQTRIAQVARQVAHDIRGPLMGLKTLERHSAFLPASERELLQVTVQRVHAIAEDLLEYSRRQRQNSVPNISEAEENLGHVLDEIKKTHLLFLKSEAAESSEISPKTNIQIDLQIDSRLQDVRNLDRRLPMKALAMSRMLSNFIQNSLDAFGARKAVDQTDLAEFVAVSVRLYNDSFVVVVQDNGPGIPEHILSKLTQEELTFGKEKGNGLALYSAAEILRGLGGDLKLRSVQNQGTQVEVIIPLSK